MDPVEIEVLVKNNTRSGLAGVSSGLDGVDKDATKAQRSVRELEAEIVKLRKAMADAPEMDMSASLKQIEALEKEIEGLQKKSQNVDLTPKNAAAATRTYNGLNVSIQQIARELSTLAMGPQMFFLAISNNLPIFTDELARARREYQALAAVGQKGIPVWRQVLSSIVSWQTALAVGIMLSVTYGKEIGQWMSSLFKGKQALDIAKVAAEQFHAVLADGTVKAQEEIMKLDLLYRTATNAAKPYKERKEAVDKLQESYSEYFDGMDAELIMAGKLQSAYDNLRASIIELSRARAAANALVENEETRLKIENTPEYASIAQWADALKRERGRMNDLLAKGISENSPLVSGIAGTISRFEKSISDYSGKIAERLELPDEAKENILQYLSVLDAANAKLSDLATKSYTLDDPTKVDKSSKSDKTESLKDQYAEARRRQQESLSEQEAERAIQLTNDSFEKERAQIRLNYDKKRAEIEVEEAKTLKLIKELRKAGASLPAGAEMEVRSQTAAQIGNLQSMMDTDIRKVDEKEQAEYDKLLEKYETYQQGRLRIAEKYDKEITMLAANPEARARAEEAKKKALEDFTKQFAGQFPEFEAWADRIVAMSVDKLKAEVEAVKNELTMLENLHPFDEGAIAKARAKVLVAEERLSKVQVKSEGKATDTTDWMELHRVLSDVISTFEDVGDAIGGASGEIIAASGKAATATLQMVNAVQAYRQASKLGDKMGMASGILGGISAGISVLTTIFSLFKGGETTMERNVRLAREFNDELERMQQGARIDSKEFDNIFGDRLFDRYIRNVDVLRESMERLEASRERIRNRGAEEYNAMSKGSTGLSGLDLADKSWESASQSIAGMQVQTRHSTWFRSAKYSSLADLLPGLFVDGEVDMAALKKFVEEGDATFQHLSASNQQMLREMVEDWETYEEALTAVRDYLSSIFGDLGSTITDAMISAAENGTDAFDAMADSVGDALRKMAKDMIYSATLGKVFEDAQKRIEAIQSEGGSAEERFAKVSEVFKNLISDTLDKQGEFTALWEEFRRQAAEQGIDIGDKTADSQQGHAGAMQAVTQESFARVEGLVTSIQIHAANIDENMEGGIMPTLGQSLEALNEIAANSKSLPLIYSLLEELRSAGIKVR